MLFGIGQGCEVPTFPIANRQYFGNVPQGSLYGWQNIGNGLGMGMAPVLAGFLWDITGNYAVPLLMSLGFSLMGLAAVLFLPPSSQVLTPHWEDALPPEARSVTPT
jgi:MFS family permease